MQTQIVSRFEFWELSLYVLLLLFIQNKTKVTHHKTKHKNIIRLFSWSQKWRFLLFAFGCCCFLGFSFFPGFSSGFPIVHNPCDLPRSHQMDQHNQISIPPPLFHIPTRLHEDHDFWSKMEVLSASLISLLLLFLSLSLSLSVIELVSFRSRRHRPAEKTNSAKLDLSSESYSPMPQTSGCCCCCSCRSVLPFDDC